jgi:O-antigen/teichoic acid export membrane protein
MFKKIFSSEIGRGAIILFVTMNIFNVLNFLFHFSMGRLLGPSDYGTLAVLMSIIYIYNIPVEAIQTIVTKYTSKFNIKKEEGKIHYLMSKSLSKSIKAAFFIFLIAFIVGFFLSKFLNINFYLIVLTNVFLFSTFSNPIVKGVLQGRKKFGKLGANFIIEGGLKLIFSVFLVFIGMKVFGAITGVLLGVFSGIIVSLYFNKDVLQTKSIDTSFNGIYGKSIPYFICMIIIYILLSIDIILSKRFFPDEIVGKYSVLSMLGKIIFFGTVSIGKTMFPITAEKNEKKQDSKKLFKKVITSMFFLCSLGIIIYYLFPELIISILYGKEYIEIAPYLVYSAIALSFLSLTQLVLLYGLSTKGLKKTKYLFIFVVLTVILLSFFHKNIAEYILAFMVSNIIMFIGSFFFLER